VSAAAGSASGIGGRPSGLARGRQPAQPHARLRLRADRNRRQLLIDGTGSTAISSSRGRVYGRAVKQDRGSLRGGRVFIRAGHPPPSTGLRFSPLQPAAASSNRERRPSNAVDQDARRIKGRSTGRSRARVPMILGKHATPFSIRPPAGKRAPRNWAGAELVRSRWLAGSAAPRAAGPLQHQTSAGMGSPEGWPGPGGSPASRAEPVRGSSAPPGRPPPTDPGEISSLRLSPLGAWSSHAGFIATLGSRPAAPGLQGLAVGHSRRRSRFDPGIEGSWFLPLEGQGAAHRGGAAPGQRAAVISDFPGGQLAGGPSTNQGGGDAPAGGRS